jgi:uncharacterized protein YcfL
MRKLFLLLCVVMFGVVGCSTKQKETIKKHVSKENVCKLATVVNTVLCSKKDFAEKEKKICALSTTIITVVCPDKK